MLTRRGWTTALQLLNFNAFAFQWRRCHHFDVLSQMKIKIRRIVRFVLGVTMPVPLFVALYYFSYFYNSYHGFDYETQTYMTGPRNIELDRYYLKADILIFLGAGYFLMGIPSIAYSFLLERHRTCSRFRLRSYAGWGTLMGGISGLIAASGRFVLTDGIYDSLMVVSVSSAVGGLIPLLLFYIVPERPPQKYRENKTSLPTGINPTTSTTIALP